MNIRNKKYIAPTAQVFDDICSSILAGSPTKVTLQAGTGTGNNKADAKSGEFAFDEDEE